MITTVKLDLKKIDKSKLFTSDKTGNVYLDAVIFWNDEPDQYGQDGMICQSVTKEERESGVRGAILGNVKNIQTQNQTSSNASSQSDAEVDDDLPF